MKKKFLSTCKTLFLSMAASMVLSFPSWAAVIQGGITNVDSNSISGWAWNKEDTNDVQTVEVHICQSGNPNPVKYLHVSADDYREDLVTKLKDGWHGFSVPIDWSQLSGSDFKVKAYAVKETSITHWAISSTIISLARPPSPLLKTAMLLRILMLPWLNP